MNIYISNLHFSVTEQELKQLFELYGEVKSVHLILDRKTKKSKGFAFIEIDNTTDAQKAIDQLNGKEIRGRMTKVSLANV